MFQPSQHWPAKKLRLSEVPVIVLWHLTPAQRRALVIADNQLALNAGWDEEMLRVELRAPLIDHFLDHVPVRTRGFTDHPPPVLVFRELLLGFAAYHRRI